MLLENVKHLKICGKKKNYCNKQKRKKVILFFSKLYCGNEDAVVIDCITQNIYLSQKKIEKLSSRKYGIGFDYLLVIEPPYDSDDDIYCRIYDKNGNEIINDSPELFVMIYHFVYQKGLSNKYSLKIGTSFGSKVINFCKDNLHEIFIGTPDFEPSNINFKAVKKEKTYILQLSEKNILCNCLNAFRTLCVVNNPIDDKSVEEKIASEIINHERFVADVVVVFIDEKKGNIYKISAYDKQGKVESSTSSLSSMIALYSDKADDTFTVSLNNKEYTIKKIKNKISLTVNEVVDSVFDGSVQI